MSKILVIGDLHGNPIWKEIIENEQNADLVVFVGDYFDSLNPKYTTLKQIHNFNEIMAFKEANSNKVITLLGNHDWNYYPEAPDKSLMSGFQGGAASMNIGYILNFNRHNLQAAFAHKNLLFTHAGASLEWMKLVVENTALALPAYNAEDMAAFINYVFEYKPLLFSFISGGDLYGNNNYQSPFWIRPRALMESCQPIKKDLIQIVGHTAMPLIDIEGKSTGKRYFFIDTINSNNEYLIIENNQFTSKKIRK